ncbi:Hypothetical predicted protein [Marmota monax]|uniref:Uncharacterized protein n=1 Tax=Marmota monax TaxID=9995 RepID=A0A5E4CMR9_MARMO|nr:Hypothetical predicted protein [Marmota monax]
MGGLELKLDGGSRIPGWTVPRVAQTGHLLRAAVQWAVNPRKPRLEGCMLWPGGMAPQACGPEKPRLPSSLAASRGVDGRMTGVLHSFTWLLAHRVLQCGPQSLALGITSQPYDLDH